MVNNDIPDYDNGWKEVIENYFEEFIFYFFPEIHKEIDFNAGFQFLDKEFSTIVKESLEKKRYVDKLVKVYLKNGTEKWILVHIEIQSNYEKEFPRRLYVYNYRISDKYSKEVITLAILTDEDKNYRPDNYEINKWGFKIRFEFPLIKLIDFKDKIDLDKAENPYHIKYEEEKKMPFITTAERIGIEKGIETGIERGELKRAGKAVLDVLEIRFGSVDDETIVVLKTIKEIDILDDLLKKAIKVITLNEFEESLKQYS